MRFGPCLLPVRSSTPAGDRREPVVPFGFDWSDVTATGLKLTLIGLAAAISASAQGVDRILVTQAGLVPDPYVSGAMPESQKPLVTPTPFVAAQPDHEVLANTKPIDPPQFSSNDDFRAIDVGQGARPSSQVMSKYVVRGDKIPDFALKDVYTKAGVVDLVFKEHPGLLVGNIRSSNREAAYEMFLNEVRSEDIHDYRDTARAMEVGGDPREAHAILKATSNAFMRDDFDPEPTGNVSDAPRPESGSLINNIEEMKLTWLTDKF
jgi:hypothetical protein